MYDILFRHDINLLDIAWHGLFDPATCLLYTSDAADE